MIQFTVWLLLSMKKCSCAGVQVWMCGGSVEVLPCSHVGHLFQRRVMHGSSDASNSRKNFFRVAEVWLDEYKNYFYQKIGYNYNREDAVCFLFPAVAVFLFVKLPEVECKDCSKRSA